MSDLRNAMDCPYTSI